MPYTQGNKYDGTHYGELYLLPTYLSTTPIHYFHPHLDIQPMIEDQHCNLQPPQSPFHLGLHPSLHKHDHTWDQN